MWFSYSPAMLKIRLVTAPYQDVQWLYKLDNHFGWMKSGEWKFVLVYIHLIVHQWNDNGEYFGWAINTKTAYPYDLSGFDFFWFCSSRPDGQIIEPFETIICCESASYAGHFWVKVRSRSRRVRVYAPISRCLETLGNSWRLVALRLSAFLILTTCIVVILVINTWFNTPKQ